jgi:hypothetical protein
MEFMATEPNTVDISETTDLLRLVAEVNDTGHALLLRKDSEDVAILSPARKARHRRGAPVTAEAPLWTIVGVAKSRGPTDVSSDKHRYLAEAYRRTE